ncbi:MAG: nucleotidyltransferase family protein [bacterium]|nr:nucleotidyltransferase family protein [bacterium]
MKALILAAGYATRLYPLTRDRAKPLLPVGGRPIIDYIADALDAVGEIDRIFVVTNSRFAASFEAWAGSRRGRAPVTVVDDGTASDDDKRGAIGDILFVIEREGIDDDLFIVAGDNLFDLDLRRIAAFARERGPVIAAYDIGDREAARRYGIVAVDGDGRIVDFREKPQDPPSTLASLGMYLIPRGKVRLFGVYAAEGNNLDQPGNFVRWLYPREPVHAYVFSGVWYDIGDLEMYRKADALYTARRVKTN